MHAPEEGSRQHQIDVGSQQGPPAASEGSHHIGVAAAAALGCPHAAHQFCTVHQHAAHWNPCATKYTTGARSIIIAYKHPNVWQIL